MVKKASRKYGVPEEDIQINLADHMAQKHGFVGLETYSDVEKLIDEIAKELKGA